MQEEEKKKTLAYTLSNPTKGDVAYPLFASGQSFTTDGSLVTGSNEKIFDIVPSTDANDRFMMIIPGRSGYMTTGGEKDEKDMDGDDDKEEADGEEEGDYTADEE